MKNYKRYDNKKKALSSIEIDNILKNKYQNCFRHTKEYIRKGLEDLGSKFKASINIIHRDDFIEQYYKSRETYDYVIKYDFSQLPEIIKNKTSKYIITCLETLGGVLIGDVTVSFNDLILQKKEGFRSIFKYLNLAKNKMPNLDKTEKAKDRLFKRYGDIYNYDTVSYIDIRIPVKLFCNKCKNYFWQRVDASRSICPNCLAKLNGDRNRTDIADWVNKAKQIHGNKCDYSKIIYKNSNTPIVNIKCNNCGSLFNQLPEAHLQGLGYCPKCSKKLAGIKVRSNLETFIQAANNIHGNRYDYSESIYITNQIPIKIFDKLSNKYFYQTPNHHLSGNGNKDFSNSLSKGEFLVLEVLDTLSISYEHSVKISNIPGRNKDYVIADFIIRDDNNSVKFWIEYNGKQHYTFSRDFKMYKHLSEDEAKNCFNRQIKRDQSVREYCKLNNIILIEIPFTIKTKDRIKSILSDIIILGKDPKDIIIQPKIDKLWIY